MSVFFNVQGIKTVYAGWVEGDVKQWQNSVHVVTELSHISCLNIPIKYFTHCFTSTNFCLISLYCGLKFCQNAVEKSNLFFKKASILWVENSIHFYFR